MALIVFPVSGWDTFVDIATCTTLSESFIGLDNEFSKIIDTVNQEAILRQTALLMSQCPNIILPEDYDKNLELAQVYLVQHALTVDMFAFDSNDRAVTNESVDVVSVSYDTNKKGSNTDFPPMVSSLLKPFGCKNVTSGFTQISLGRG